MPLLQKEPCVYPEGLLTRPHPEGDGEARWWVLHTRPRAEKAVARVAYGERISFFLPVYHRRWLNAGRKFSAYLPLFPGYVFLHGDNQGRQRLLETNSVAQSIPVADQGQLHGDLMRVYRLIEAGMPMTPEDQVQPGARVVITEGPLQGFEGKVTRCGRHLKLWVEVEFIRRGVSVEIDRHLVRPLGPAEDRAL
jgi:transcriptional antiterminator RfaH